MMMPLKRLEGVMTFKQTRKAIKAVRSSKLQKDFADALKSVERATDRRVAGHRVSSLISVTIALRNSLPLRTRFAIADAIFADAAAAEVPHQWEKKEGYECGPKNDCSKPNQDKSCIRDTSSQSCISN
jgi:hypothetical protein